MVWFHNGITFGCVILCLKHEITHFDKREARNVNWGGYYFFTTFPKGHLSPQNHFSTSQTCLCGALAIYNLCLSTKWLLLSHIVVFKMMEYVLKALNIAFILSYHCIKGVMLNFCFWTPLRRSGTHPKTSCCFDPQRPCFHELHFG